jgi:hypothetical protein
MKLENVLEIFLMLMLEKFLDWFVFIWAHEQCSKTFSIIILKSYYYSKDLKHVYYVCCSLNYGKQDQTLLIENEPSKVF